MKKKAVSNRKKKQFILSDAPVGHTVAPRFLSFFLAINSLKVVSSEN
jgi:hypothetical protein